MPDRPPPRDARTLLLASAIGTIIEWYDFFVFASAAALVFDRTFFPTVDPRTGVLLSLMTFAVGFVTRPLGGLVFGIVGDRFGRKRALLWSLSLMGVATMAVGLVPSYARIGVLAPVLLVVLRLVQGMAVGGEVGGALLLVAESLPGDRRGFWTAWPMIGGAGGNLLASLVLAALGASLSEAAFASWGWRVAFLASGVLIAVGVWIRRGVEESPLYLAYVQRRAARAQQAKRSLGATLAAHWQSVLTVFLVKTGENALFYVFTTFFVVFATRVVQLPRTIALEGSAALSVAEIATVFLTGRWSDRVGRRPVTAVGFVAAAVWAFALFPALGVRTPAAIILAGAVCGICHGTIVGGMSAFFVELFPTSARYTGFSVGYQFASIVSGAIAPLIGIALLRAFGSALPVSLYAAAMTGPALVALGMSNETAGRDLDVDD